MFFVNVKYCVYACYGELDVNLILLSLIHLYLICRLSWIGVLFVVIK